jgi:hypothetical protein
MFVNVDSRMMFHINYACMFMVCNLTIFDMPNYNGLLAITTKSKVEGKNYAVSACYFKFEKLITNKASET